MAVQLGRERLILLRDDDDLGIEFSWIGAERAGAAGDDDPHVAFGAVIGTNRGLDGCIAVNPPESWQRLLEKMRKFSPGDARARAFRRVFMQDAMEVTVDSQGRITIPPALITHAALGKEAVLHGSDTCIEIWNPERFAQLTKKVVDTPGDYEELAAGLFKEEA